MWPFRKKDSPVQPGAAAGGAAPSEYSHYRILRREDGMPWELGRGAMGITYKAEDVNLCVPVALKVISPALAMQPGAREFFLSEARGAASLRHRNAAAVHHLGTNGAGELFFAMEFIEGETIEAVIKRQRRLGVASALDFAQQTACALAAAAQRGLVHRDLKPANLMLSNEGDGTLVVKVIDFGLCKVFSPGGAAKAGEQPQMKFLGTPHYASPEQIRCEDHLDSRSDFYSLGATLWTMLSGRTVFNGPLPVIRQSHLEKEPPFDELPEEVSASVRALLASLLHKDPAGRPRTPLELIDRIEGAAYDHRGAENDPRKHWKVQGCVPMLGSVLAHNYHLEALADESQGIGGGDPVFRAEDIAGRRPVAVHLLDRDKPLDGVRAALERLAAAPHPNLVQNHAVSSCRGQPFVVNEWLNGFPLTEVLRARGGTLPSAEVQRLMLQATQAVDHAHRHGLGKLNIQTSAIRVHFTGQPLDDEQRRLLPGRPVDSWPDFILKFRLQGGNTAYGQDETMGDASSRESLRLLGHLAAEMLGSRESSTVAAFGSSAPEEEEEVNLPDAPPEVRRLINQAISPDATFGSGSEFVTALTLAFQGGDRTIGGADQTQAPIGR